MGPAAPFLRLEPQIPTCLRTGEEGQDTRATLESAVEDSQRQLSIVEPEGTDTG